MSFSGKHPCNQDVFGMDCIIPLPHFRLVLFTTFRLHAMPTTKADSKQQHLSFVWQVATEVSALQAADRRKVADEKAAQRKEQTGPRVTVAFDPGPPPEPSDSDEGELTENLRMGDDALGPTAPNCPFTSQKWRTPTTAPWAEMPCTIGTPLGLLCLIYAGVSTVETGCRWSKGTAIRLASRAKQSSTASRASTSRQQKLPKA